jgi:integrase
MTSLPEFTPPYRERLVLFTGENSDAPEQPQKISGRVQLSREMSLSEFYAAWVKPMCRDAPGRDEGTVEQDELALARWSEITGDPPLKQIDDWICAEFVKQLRKRKGLGGNPEISPNTIRKTCGHLQFMLDRASPKSRRNRKGAGLFDLESPYLERPKKRSKPPVTNFTLHEIGAWMDACQYASQTSNLYGIPAVKWWRSLVRFVYNTGLRIDTVMECTWDMVGRNKPDFITIPPEVYKGGEHGLEMYLNGWARQAIDEIRTAGFNKLFPWRGWPKSSSWLQSRRRAILRRSTIVAHRRFGFHGLRRALASWVGPINGLLAKIILGHVTNDVTAECYINPDTMREILSKVPQPGQMVQKGLGF